jgi:peptide/nickel transport system substrate-binding protein
MPSTPADSGETAEPDTTPATSQPQRGGSLRIAFPGVASTLDPALMYVLEEYFATSSMYERLVFVDMSAPQEVRPMLATEWNESDDGLRWTFTLRDGITFHDGAPFGAEDVVYTFERILNPEVGAAAYQVLDFLETVQALDEQTVQFNLKRPSAEFLALLSFDAVSIIQRDRDEDALMNEPIGTGPFQFAEFLPGERLRMTRNENYWQPDLPYLDEIQHLYLPEAVTRMEALNSGVVDMLWNVELEQLPVVEANADFQVMPGMPDNYQPIILNMKHAPLNDVRVRDALKLCVDRAGMVQAVTQGRGAIANDQPIFSWHPLYADIPQRTQDIEQAKVLLAEAGYGDGLTLEMATSTIRTGMHESAIAFQEMAQQAGITIELKQLPTETFWGEYLKYPLSVSNNNYFMPSLDANLAFSYHSGGYSNEPGYKNEELDSLIEDVSTERDEQKRVEMYAEIQRIIHEDGAWIIPYSRALFVISHNSVHNVAVPSNAIFDVTSVWKEQEG